MNEGWETGPPAYRPYPRRLERPWVLVRPELNSRPPAWQPGAQPTEPPVRGGSVALFQGLRKDEKTKTTAI